MQKTIEQAPEWENIWKRQNALDQFIDAGRTVYNWFFRRLLLRHVTKDSTLLEMGCGRASLTLSLCPHIKKLVGVDISDTAVQQATAAAARLGYTNASFIIDDCTDLSLSERFNAVWSQGLLEHFDDPITVAREHYRALAPGGVALLSVPYKYSYHSVWYGLTRPKVLRRFWPWTEQRFFDHKELREVGNAVAPHVRTYLLSPFPLGIILLEMRRPLTEADDTSPSPTPRSNTPHNSQ